MEGMCSAENKVLAVAAPISCVQYSMLVLCVMCAVSSGTSVCIAGDRPYL